MGDKFKSEKSKVTSPFFRHTVKNRPTRLELEKVINAQRLTPEAITSIIVDYADDAREKLAKFTQLLYALCQVMTASPQEITFDVMRLKFAAAIACEFATGDRDYLADASRTCFGSQRDDSANFIRNVVLKRVGLSKLPSPLTFECVALLLFGKEGKVNASDQSTLLGVINKMPAYRDFTTELNYIFSEIKAMEEIFLDKPKAHPKRMKFLDEELSEKPRERVSARSQEESRGCILS